MWVFPLQIIFEKYFQSLPVKLQKNCENTIDDAIETKSNADVYVDIAITEKEILFECIVKAEIPLNDGG